MRGRPRPHVPARRDVGAEARTDKTPTASHRTDNPRIRYRLSASVPKCLPRRRRGLGPRASCPHVSARRDVGAEARTDKMPTGSHRTDNRRIPVQTLGDRRARLQRRNTLPRAPTLYDSHEYREYPPIQTNHSSMGRSSCARTANGYCKAGFRFVSRTRDEPSV